MSQIKSKWILKDTQSLEDDGSGNLRVKVVGANALERTASGLQVKNLGVTNDMLAGSIAESKLADTFIRADGANNFSANQSLGGFRLTNLGAPTASTDAATKGYVDSAIAGLDWQADVEDVQVDNTLDVSAAVTGDRYILTNVASLHASFGTIAGVTDNDIVEFDGTNWFIAYDLPEAGNGAIAWNRGLGRFELWDGVSWEEFGGLAGVTAGNGLTKTGNTIDLNVDNSTVEVNADVLRVKDAGITAAKLGANSVTAAKLNADTAGNGLSLSAGGLDVNVDDSTIEIDTDALRLKANGVTASHINTSAIGDGLVGGGGSAISVQGGNGIAVGASVALGGLLANWNTGGEYTITGLIAPTNASDAATKQYVDDLVAGLNARIVERFTLTGTDITNAYVTLSSAPVTPAYVGFDVKGAPHQFYGDDYTVTGSAVSWSALGLDTVLEAGDKVTAQYDA